MNRSLIAARVPSSTDSNRAGPTPRVETTFADAREREGGEQVLLRDAVSLTTKAHAVRASGQRE